MLIQIEREITAKVPKPLKEEFDKILIAAETILFNPKSHQNMTLIKHPESRQYPVETISEGVAGLMWMLYIRQKRKLSVETIIYGGIVVICKVLDFAERGLKMQITNQIIADTVKKACEKIFERMGITPKELMNAIENGHNDIQEYQKHQAFLASKMPSAKAKASSGNINISKKGK
jgi:hypothetical protein